ncbi:MAG: transposase [Alphaproteobacteria bacterium]|nr:transposase [Alphaproteobacteria bacterium]
MSAIAPHFRLPGFRILTPGPPWENGYNESFNGKLRHECLNTELFCTLREAPAVIEMWRHQYNTILPRHSSLCYQPPVPQTIQPAELRPAFQGVLDRSAFPRTSLSCYIERGCAIGGGSVKTLNGLLTAVGTSRLWGSALPRRP